MYQYIVVRKHDLDGPGPPSVRDARLDLTSLTLTAITLLHAFIGPHSSNCL